MKTVILKKSARIYLLLFVLFFSFKSVNGQCPTPPSSTLIYPASNPGTVANGQVLVIPSGQNFTGGSVEVANGGTIYVASGAVLSKTLNNFRGRVINCGTATFPSIDFAGPNATIENYNLANINGMNINSANKWLNGLKAKMNFNFSVILNNSTITNNGSIKVSGSITTNGNNVNVINHDSLTTTGSISLNGTIYNDGYLFALGSGITLNANGNMTNGCYFLSQGNFRYNGNSTDTLTVTGLIWAKNADFSVAGSGRLNLNVGGYIQGSTFYNDGSVFGTGNLYFTGATKNQGPFGAGGTAARHLNFYDSSPTAGQIMDEVNTPINASVTRNVLNLVDNSTFVPTTCSNIIKEQACILNKPNAGSDIVVSGEDADLTDAITANGQIWSFVSGPVTPTTNTLTGEVAGLTKRGDYFFKLANTTFNTCTDTVKVSVSNNFPVAPDCPKLAIPNEFISATFTTPVLSGSSITGTDINPPNVNYTASRPGGSVLYRNIGTVNTGNSTVNLDMKVTFLSTTAPSDLDGYMYFSTDPAIPGDMLWRLGAWPAGTVNTVKIEFFQTGTSIPATYSGVWNFSDIDSPADNERVALSTTVMGNYLITPTSNVTVTTTGGYTLFTGSGNNPNGNPDPNFAFSAIVENVQSFTMKLTRGGSQTDYTINGNKFNYIASASCTKSDQYITSEDNLLSIAAPGLLLNDTDKDGDPLSISRVQGTGAVNSNVILPSGAIVNVRANGTFTYDPRTAFNYLNTGQTRVDSFYYQVSDGQGGFDLGTVTITVIGVNDAPNAVDDYRTTNQAIPVVINQNLNDTDPEGNLDPSTSVAVTNPLNGIVTKNNVTGVLTYTPNPTFSGRDSLIYRVCDTGNPSLCGTAKIVIVVIKGPSDTLTVTGSTVCSTIDSATVTIRGAQSGVTYEAYKGTVLLASRTGNGTNLILRVPVSKLTIGTNTISFIAKQAGFLNVILLKTATIIVNPNPGSTNPVFSDPVVCANNQTATVDLSNLVSGVKYVFSLAGVKIDSLTASGATASIAIPVSKLNPISNTVTIRTLDVSGSITGCITVVFADKAVITINPVLTSGFPVFSDPVVCSNDQQAVINITNAIAGVKYVFSLNGVKIDSVIANTTNASLAVAVSKLSPLANTVTVRTLDVTGSVTNCLSVLFNDKSVITVNPVLVAGLPAFSDPVVCSNSKTATINLTNVINGVKYVFSLAGTKLDSVTANSTSASLDLAISKLNPLAGSVTTRTLDVTGFIANCNTVVFNDKAIVTINPLPDSALAVTGGVSCGGVSDPTVSVAGTRAGEVYQAFKESTPIGSPVTSTGGLLVITLPSVSLGIGTHIIKVSSTIAGCAIVQLKNTATVVVNEITSETLTVKGSTVCSNSGNATVTLEGTKPGETYQAYKDNTLAVGLPVTSTGATTTLLLPVSSLGNGSHVIYVRSRIAGCGERTLLNTALVIINKLPEGTLPVTGSVVCINSLSAKLFVENTSAGESYQAFEETVAKGNPVISAGGTVEINILLGNAPDQLNRNVFDHVMRVESTIAGCDIVQVKDTGLIRINPLPDSTLTVTGSVNCVNSPSATLTVSGTKAGVLYQAYEGANPVGVPVLSTGGSTVLTIPIGTGAAQLNKFVSDHILQVQASIQGCANITLTNTGLVKINQLPDSSLTVSGYVGCGGSADAQITVEGTKAGELYQAYKGAVKVGDPVLSSGGTVIIFIPVNQLGIDTSIINVTSEIPGCAIVTLKDTARVILNNDFSSDLIVTGDTVCSNDRNAYVTIKGTKALEIYKTLLNNKQIRQDTTSPGGDFRVRIPVDSLVPGVLNTIRLQSVIPGCGAATLVNPGLVLVNNKPDINLNLIGGTVCSNSLEATVKVINTKPSETYIAFLGNTALDTILSNGSDITLILPVNKLTEGENFVTAYVSISGCGLSLLNKSAVVIVNGLPEANLIIKGDTVCSEGNAASAVVQILNSKKSVTYTAYSGVIPIGQPVVSAGGNISLILPLSQLNTGINLITFTASIEGCALVNLTDTAKVLVNQIPPLTSDLEGSVVCSDALSATVTIKNTALNAEYQAKMSGNNIGLKGTGNGNDLILDLPVKDLKPDTNLIYVDVQIKGCTSGTLTKSAQVVVNTKPSSDLATEGDIVCETSLTASVKINLTQKNVSYQAYLNDVAIGTPELSTGGLINLTIPVQNLPDSLNKLTVKASILKCDDVNLKDTALIIINKLPATSSVNVTGSSVCPGEDGEITMSGGDKDIIYNVFVNGTLTNFIYEGQTPAKIITVPSALLSNNVNNITLTATIPACGPVNISDAATVYVLSKKLSIAGKNLVCDSSVGDYLIDTLVGALSYKWTVDNDASLISPDSAPVITIRFGSKSVGIKVSPVGIRGTCPVSGDSLFVEVQQTVRGIGSISSRDTICLNETDTVSVKDITGATYFTWIWPKDSVTYLGQAKKHNESFFSEVIKYEEPGFVRLKAKAYSRCAGAYTDSVTKVVRVLSVPVAEANEYDISPMKGLLNPVQLNGNGSSVTSGSDTISYKWYTDRKTQAYITNENTLNDAFIHPAGKETKVYLKASNINGYCPVTDSAVVKVNFGIDIPNVFTPNGDDVHDNWEIKNINIFFPNCTVEVFNKWGSFVYRSATGYPEPWDGKRNGEELPVATYYYVVDLKDGNKPFVGSVTIIR